VTDELLDQLDFTVSTSNDMVQVPSAELQYECWNVYMKNQTPRTNPAPCLTEFPYVMTDCGRT